VNICSLRICRCIAGQVLWLHNDGRANKIVPMNKILCRKRKSLIKISHASRCRSACAGGVVVSSPRRRAQNLGVQYLRLTHRLGWSTLNGRRTAPSTTQSTPHRTSTTFLDAANTITTPQSHERPLYTYTQWYVNASPRAVICPAPSDCVGWSGRACLPTEAGRR
jgi:hypothetical protein